MRILICHEICHEIKQAQVLLGLLDLFDGFDSRRLHQLNKPAYLLDMRVFPCIIGVCVSFEFDSVVSQMRR